MGVKYFKLNTLYNQKSSRGKTPLFEDKGQYYTKDKNIF